MTDVPSWAWRLANIVRCSLAMLCLVPTLSGAANAEDQAIVLGNVDDIEVFERVVFGRGLQADWATTKLDLLATKDLTIQILVSSAAQSSSDLAGTAENTAQKILTVASMTMGRQMDGRVAVERVDELGRACEAFLGSGPDAGGRNVILIAIGDKARDCTSIAQRPPFDFTMQSSDLDLEDNGLLVRLSCISRFRIAARDNGKMTVVAAIPAGNKSDSQFLRFCLFDRSFSFFGFRGRFIYDPGTAKNVIESLRAAPKAALLPSVADLVMMAIAYRYLGGGENYATVRDEIKKALPPLR